MSGLAPARSDSLPLAEVRRVLRTGLSHRSEPVLVVGDQFVPAVALWAGALRRERRARLGQSHRVDTEVVSMVTTDLERVHAAIAAAWSGALAIPAWDRPSPRRAALVVATPWAADGLDPSIVLSLLGGSALVVRPDPHQFEELLEALLRWKPWRAEITDEQLAWLRRRPEGREALSGFGHLLVVPTVPTVPVAHSTRSTSRSRALRSQSWPAQRIS